MKIICCSHSSWLGGAELALVELLKSLRQRGDVSVTVPVLDGPLVAKMHDIGIEQISAHSWPLWMMQDTFTLKRSIKCIIRIWKAVNECLRFMKAARPDMVVINTVSSPVPLIACKLLHIPSVVFIHENGGFGVYRFLFGEKCTFKLLGKLASKLVCNSKYTYSIYSQYIHSSKLSVIYQPINITPIPRREHEGFVVGSVGITSTQKNFQLLIDALRTILDAQLKIVGFNNNEHGAYLREYAIRIGVGDRVEWIGLTDDMPDFYSRIDVLVACGKHEALGRSVVEAMKCRVPVIAMRDGGYVELIGEDERGWLFEKDNMEDLQKKITQARTYDWTTIVHSAEEYASSIFSFESFSKEVDKSLYNI